MIYARWTPWASRGRRSRAGCARAATPWPSTPIWPTCRPPRRSRGRGRAAHSGPTTPHGSMPFSRPIRAHLAGSAIPRSASTTGWSRRGDTRAPAPQRDATCASGETLTAKAPKRAISSSSGHRGPRRSTTATSRPWWPGSASRSSCSSSRCRTPTPATPGPACPSARSACARASRGSSSRSGARRRRSCPATPPRRAGCRGAR